MCNRNKTAARFLAAFLAVATLVSCQEDYGEPDAFIDVPENDITVDFNGLNSAGKVPYVEIGSNVPWSVTECPQWVTPSTMSSDRGRLNVFFVCEENLSGADRSGKVSVSGAGIVKSFNIIQTLKVETLELSETEFSVKGDGKLATGQAPSFYILDVNSDWTITADSWINPGITSGQAGQYIQVTLEIDENTTSSVRTGHVTVKAGNTECSVTVIQAVNGLEVGLASIAVNKFGFQDGSDSPVSFTVTSDVPWTAESDVWIQVSPLSGEAGTTEVSVTVSGNTEGSLRTGTILFSASTGATTPVEVMQSSTPYEDDNVFFKDDFSWLSPYIEQYNAKNSKPVGDAVGSGDEGANAPNVYASGTLGIFGPFITEFNERGYRDLRYVAGEYECMYLQDAYLKFGKTDYHSGLGLPSIGDIRDGEAVSLIFDWCAQMTGSGNIDKLTLTVETENGGTVVSPQMPVSPDQEKGELKWQTVTVRIEGLTAASVIKIRPTQMDLGKDESPDQQRWYIDNIRIERAN
ncbi:MAG: BACON domain-containing protein [Bacteroidetes bacterium]|uniref:BACON domain-containing protein n=1 Tax=Candidatus Cryptobacteroides avicola TaxID=2840757 RepID=A0A940DPS0_9BACT|nr:BACON domain-containing protein [Candidatus Cryptobacteroides avicola]